MVMMKTRKKILRVSLSALLILCFGLSFRIVNAAESESDQIPFYQFYKKFKFLDADIAYKTTATELITDAKVQSSEDVGSSSEAVQEQETEIAALEIAQKISVSELVQQTQEQEIKIINLVSDAQEISEEPISAVVNDSTVPEVDKVETEAPQETAEIQDTTNENISEVAAVEEKIEVEQAQKDISEQVVQEEPEVVEEAAKESEGEASTNDVAAAESVEVKEEVPVVEPVSEVVDDVEVEPVAEVVEEVQSKNVSEVVVEVQEEITSEIVEAVEEPIAEVPVVVEEIKPEPVIEVVEEKIPAPVVEANVIIDEIQPVSNADVSASTSSISPSNYVASANSSVFVAKESKNSDSTNGHSMLFWLLAIGLIIVCFAGWRILNKETGKMGFLSQLNLKQKVIMVLLLPLISLLYFSIQGINEKKNVSTEMKVLDQLIQLSVHMGNFVHESQKERGVTAGFLGSKGTEFIDKLATQRGNADGKVVILKKYLESFDVDQFDSGFSSKFDNAMSYFNQLASKRNAISSLSLSVGQGIGYYSQMNVAFMDTMNYIVHISNNASVTQQLSAFGGFINSKERAGQERAVITETFAQNKFGPGMFEKFIGLVTTQGNYADVFLSYANEEQIDFYNLRMQGQFVDEVNRMKKVAAEKAADGNFGIEASYWFDNVTGKINLLKDVEDKLTGDLQVLTRRLAQEAHQEEIWLWIVTSIILGITIFFGFITIQAIVIPINSAINGLTESMKKSTTFVDRVALASKQLSDGATEQASSLEETSSSLDEMASMTKQNADNASQANQMAIESRNQAEDGDVAMREMKEAMDGINDSSSKISKIIKTIEEIAFQTNLLALNAAVEAARAGDHGKGFAVVADEVRNLAQRSAVAAKDTAQLIEESINNAKIGSDIANKAGDVLSQIMDSSKKVADVINEIAAASKEQSEGIGQITNAVSQMDTVTQQNASSAEQTAFASGELKKQSGNLRYLIGDLQGLVGGGSNSNGMPRSLKLASTSRISKRMASPKANVLKRPPRVPVTKKPVQSQQPKNVIPLDNYDGF